MTKTKGNKEGNKDSIKISSLMKEGPPKRTMKYLEDHPGSTPQNILVQKISHTLKEAREILNLLRKSGFVSAELKNRGSGEKIHLFSAYIFTKDTLPLDINERIKQIYDQA